MSVSCEKISKVLGAWLDGEIKGREFDVIQLHVEQCPSCHAEKLRIERLQRSLAAALKAQASAVSWPSFWAGVARKVRDDGERREGRWRLPRWTALPGRWAWAVPLVVVGALAIVLGSRFLAGGRKGPLPSNLAAVESIDGHGFNVALLREAETKTTVIWLFLNEGEDEPASQIPVAATSR